MVTWQEIASIVLQVCVALAINNLPNVVAERKRLCSAVVSSWGTPWASDGAQFANLNMFRQRVGGYINDECRRVREMFEVT